jgi:CHAD domain-containing protein
MQSRLGDLHDHVFAVQRVHTWLERRAVPRTQDLLAFVKQEDAARRRQHGDFVRRWPMLRARIQQRLAAVSSGAGG